MSPLVIVALLAGVAAVSVFVTLVLTRKGDGPDEWKMPPPSLPPPAPGAQAMPPGALLHSSAPAATKSAKIAAAPPPAARQGDLLALAETTMRMDLAPAALAKGPEAPLPGMGDAYDRIAKGEIHAHLQVIDGPARGRGAELPHEGKVTVGRGAGNKIDLRDGGVSIDQCVFESDGSEVIVRDMGSRNGTFVNGDRVKETRRLSNCDIVACGASRILVTLDAAPAGMTE